MVKADEAVKIAQEQMRAWFGDELQALALEEVELSSDDRSWLITLGYGVKREHLTASELMSAPAGTSPNSIRAFKVFKIDVETGEVRSMKRPKS